MADTFKPLQAQNFTLAGAGSSIADQTLVLSSMLTIDGVAITMADIGAIGYFTLEPGNGAQEEAGTFTGITQNVNGTAALTGVKHQLFEYPYTQTAGLTKSHAGGTSLILSNTAGFYESISGKANDETVTGIWTFTAPNYPRMDSVAVPPVTDEEFATKKYVDDTAIAGGAKATETVYGISKLSVAAVSAVAPIVVGDNDNRVSPVSLATVTADRVAALAGTGTPNGTTGKYVTNDDTSATSSANKVVRYTAGGMLKSATTAASVAGDVVALDAAAKLPAVDGSQLTGLPNPTKYQVVIASNTLQASADTERINTTGGSYILQKEFVVYKQGTYRVKFDGYNAVNTGGNAKARIYKNGVAYGTEINLQAVQAYQTYSEDLVFAVNDLVQLYTLCQSSDATEVYVRNFRLYYDRTYINDSVVSVN